MQELKFNEVEYVNGGVVPFIAGMIFGGKMALDVYKTYKSAQ